MRKPKHDPGTFLRIPLADGSYGYGRYLESPYFAFYDHRTTEPSTDLDVIASRPILFKISVRRSPGGDKWEVIGKKPLEGELLEPIVQFMQDLADFRQCTIFDTAGMEKDVPPEECLGLERASVWETHGVENRLLDRFRGRPNQAELRQRVRLK